MEIVYKSSVIALEPSSKASVDIRIEKTEKRGLENIFLDLSFIFLFIKLLR